MSMSPQWLAAHVTKAITYAGPRYTPTPNITVATSTAFDGLARSNDFFTRLQLIRKDVRKCRTNCAFDYSDRADLLATLESTVSRVEEQLDGVVPAERDLPFAQLKLVASDLEALARVTISKMVTEPEPRRSTYWLGELASASSRLQDFCDDPAARLANSPFLLLKGPAGAGKTHLVCDVARRRQEMGAATVILFGDRFEPGDPWAQILRLLGPGFRTPADLLGALNELGEESGQRSLIFFDAINEGAMRSGWKRGVHSVIDEVERHSQVGVCFTVRSGFESIVLGRRDIGRLVSVEHPGFGDSEWDAVEAFFHAYDVPLPEIPLVADEFQNPLFLKLFCRAFGGSRRSFRGHYGATYVFEAYAKACGRDVLRELRIPGRRDYVWRQIVKPLAEWMGLRGSAEVPAVVATRIVEEAQPNRGQELLSAMEHNGLLVKHPRLNRRGRVHRYAYAFPYQKFSDHLVVRCLLNTHFDKRQPEAAFRRNRKLGSLARSPFQRGLIEAMATQIPERVPTELPYLLDDRTAKSSGVAEAFIESLIWRDPARTNDETLNYINSVVVRKDLLFRHLLEAWVTIAPVPGHAFNANRLHEFLMSRPLSQRDCLWTTALHWNYGVGSAVDRLIRWGRRAVASGLNDESLHLFGLTLGWCLAASNRALRDRATKALVSLYSLHASRIPALLEAFEGVDDPYVSERLMAAAYGATLRTGDSSAVASVAQYVMDHVFGPGRPSSHILLRDYARGVVERANYLGSPPRGDLSRARPPYSSQWPTRAPSVLALQRDYGDKQDYWAIWNSVMGDGDFARHVVDPQLANWSRRRLGADGRSQPIAVESRYFDDGFDIDFAHRWIFKRVVDLGWRPTLFGEFEGMARFRDEDTPRVERIGKKYQWIAYHELLGLVSDHFELMKWGTEDSSVYEGPWNPHVRDIDPTCMLDGTEVANDEPWIVAPTYSPEGNGAPHDQWLRESNGLSDPPIPILHESPGGVPWITLGGELRWLQPTSPADPERAAPHGLLWCALKCYAVRRGQLPAAYEWASSQRFRGRTMLELRAFHEVFLREFPWAPAYTYVSGVGSNRQGWTEAWHGTTMPVPVLPTCDAYLGESATQDYSVEEAVNLRFPAAWIFRQLDLAHSQVDGESSLAGVRFALNPKGDGWQLVLTRRDVLLAWLEAQGLDLLWTVEGEKLVVGERDETARSRLNLSGAYRLRDDLLEGRLRTDVEE